MNGMQMMMKQFGIDPEELQKQLLAGKTQAEEWLKSFDARLKALQTQNETLEKILIRIEGKLDAGNY